MFGNSLPLVEYGPQEYPSCAKRYRTPDNRSPGGPYADGTCNECPERHSEEKACYGHKYSGEAEAILLQNRSLYAHTGGYKVHPR